MPMSTTLTVVTVRLRRHRERSLRHAKRDDEEKGREVDRKIQHLICGMTSAAVTYHCRLRMT